jgi:glutathione S-transferase
MVKLPYQTVSTLDPRRAPKGKLPYIDDNGTVIADSALIIEYLQRTYGDPLDGKLTKQDRTLAHLLRRTLEESLYWCALYDRWAVEENWRLTRKAFFGSLPLLLRRFVSGQVRKGMLKSLYRQGTGRHTRDEVYALGIADVSALADSLADKPYFLGAEPTSLDASAYAFIANLLWAPIDSPLSLHTRAQKTLVAYAERMKARYFA